MRYKIYQLKKDRKDYIFMDFSFAVSHGFKKEDYDLVYEDDYVREKGSSIESFLDELFLVFNAQHPEGFKGHSLSVSDLVEVKGKTYYCDSFGWKKVENNGKSK